jgi:hypothetical protein
MMKFLNERKGVMRGRPRTRTTSISFNGQELVELGRLVAAGRVVLQRSHPVVARLKAAMTRVKVAVPEGL